MKRLDIILLSLVLLGGIAAWVGFQWNETHVFNPLWHPHARFHAVQLGLVFCGLSLLSLWLLWSKFIERRKAILLASATPLLFWGGEFVGLLVPGTHPSPDLIHPNTFSLFGAEIHGNLFFSGVMLLFTVIAIALMLRRKHVSS